MTNKQIYLIGLFVAICLALFTGGRFIYFIAVTMLVVFLSSYWMVWWNSKNMYLFFNISEEVLTVEDNLWIEYKLTNMSILPAAYVLMTFVVSKRLGEMEFPSEAAYFGPYQMITIRKNVTCRNRGFFTIGKLLVDIRDPLGLFERQVVFDRAIDLTVYPKVHDIQNFNLPAKEFFGRISVPLQTHEDFTSMKSIREYRRGDNTKKIHWKLSSKMEHPYVKEFDLSADTKVYMMVDGFRETINPENLDLQDGLVETSISLIRYFLENDVAISLVCNTKNRLAIEGKDMERFGLYLDELTGYIPTGEKSFVEFVRGETSKLYFGSTIITLTDSLSESLLYTLLGLREKRFDVVLILYGENSMIMPDELEILKNRGVLSYCIPTRKDISKLLEVRYETKAF
tara:strand:- start:359 stop:1555 length:1197 start_codon:yes stop_codon:yes gene_type:complete